ncbi:MAG: DNA polymerase III subunit beta [Candidatus Magasanikbacteria bacterium]|nr:DNA polymerase III subunit beta [Candidatus Magasanikbacteria bacterium]
MKFTCTKENLNHALALVGGLTGKQTNLPILSNILIKVEESKVNFISTNLEIAVKVDLRAKVEKTGTFTVPAKTLSDYISLLSDEQINLSQKDNELIVKCGNSSTKIKGSSAEDFPLIPDIEEEHSYTLDSELFKDSLSKTVVAAAKNEIRPELSGVYFNFVKNNKNLVLAATDSYRLAEKQVELQQGDDEFDCIVPGRAVYEMIRLINLSKNIESETKVRLWVSENQIAIRFNDFEMSSRLVDGKYPDYTQIIPGEFKTTATVPTDIMINKIKAASLFTTLGVNAVSFDLNVENNTVGISSTSTQTGEHSSEIDAAVEGEENSILLNHRYVLEGLQNMTGEVEFKVNSADAPCLLKPKTNNNYIYIVMPIRQ